MFLERIEIKGFRGIEDLTVSLGQTTALIGENAWGKTSLLRALWCLLGHENVPYQFNKDDFFCPKCVEDKSELSIILLFREHRPGICEHSERLRRLSSVWCKYPSDLFHRIRYVSKACMQNGVIETSHHFENAQNLPLTSVDADLMIQILSFMNPVLRLRDSRSDEAEKIELDVRTIQSRNDFSIPDLSLNEQHEVIRQFDIAKSILTRYLSNAPRRIKKTQKDFISQPMALSGLLSWKTLLDGMNDDTRLQVLARFGHSLTQAYSGRVIEDEARPIYILEDPESRLHPTLLSNIWGMIQLLPGQKVLTTNSGDLLSSMPLEQIRRLVRSNGKTKCHHIQDNHLSSDDIRKITFHVRINRPMTLFARSWLLVEGETELWLLSELAQLCGYHLHGEGVRIIEYAQSGYSPLIKLANDFGISWHLMADGDEAGVKYVQGARRLIHSEGEHHKGHLTLLPERDIEHFLFKNGFEDVFRQEAHLQENHHQPISKIIERAISHRSKPGMALAVLEAAFRKGPESVPVLLREMFHRVVGAARLQM